MNRIENDINNCLRVLHNSQTFLYPTDTVWGIGCDPFDEIAVSKIYQIKNRIESKSLILLVSSLEMLQKYVVVDFEKSLLHSEKPTTFIFNQTKDIPNFLLAEDNSIALRITTEPFTNKLIESFQKPIISTSANISGQSSPSNYKEIDSQILSAVDYVVNSRQNETLISKPSSIIKILPDGEIEILRK